MKVGLIVYGSIETVSGGYLYDRKLVAHLLASGDEVEIISLPRAGYASHLLDNLSLRLPTGCDILIEDELVHPSLLSANARRSPRVPVVSLVHNLRSSERGAAWRNALVRRVEKQHLGSVDGFIFNSTVTQDSVQRLVGDDKPAVLAPPGGNRLGSLTPEAVSKRVAEPGPLRLLFLANVTPLKGLHVVLDALRALPNADCTLDVAGSLSAEARYARQMQKQAGQLATPVRFHGVLDEEPLKALLKSSDALVVPSYWEGFGIAYLEGMAFGLPAIGTTAGAIPQMIHDGENGALIAPGDSAALAGVIRRLAADRQALERLSLNALSYFEACPTWERSGEMVRSFLLEMQERSR